MSYIPISLDIPQTAFGEVSTAALTPILQVTFPYNINLATVTTGSTGTGAVSHSNAKAILQTGATANSSASMVSRRSGKYKTGQGGLGRFTAVFTTGSSIGSIQECGVGELRSLTDRDGFYFTMSGSYFGIMRARGGETTFVSQSNWNVDRMDGSSGSLNPSKQTLRPEYGNVYQIRYQWLGYGAIRYYIEDSLAGKFQLVHTEQYANTSTIPSVFNPVLPISYFVQNGPNAQNVKLETPSIALFSEGEYRITGPTFSAFVSASGATNKNMITLRNNTTFPSGSSQRNKTGIFLQAMSLGNTGNSSVRLSVVEGATITSPTWVNVSGQQSVMSYDTSGTYVAGSGQILGQFILVKDDSQFVPLWEYKYEIFPGRVISIISSNATTETVVGITWVEDF